MCIYDPSTNTGRFLELAGQIAQPDNSRTMRNPVSKNKGERERVCVCESQSLGFLHTNIHVPANTYVCAHPHKPLKHTFLYIDITPAHILQKV